MRHPCRCRGCKGRKTLTKHPDQYIRPPVCSCGRSDWAVDHYRMRVGPKENKLCHCGHVTSLAGRPIHPHRWGCKGCFHRDDLLLEMAVKGKGGIQTDEPEF